MRLGARGYCLLGVASGILAWSGVLAVGRSGAEDGKYVITFDHVAVEGFVGIFDSPEVAHLERPDEDKRLRSAAGRDSGTNLTSGAGDISSRPGQLEGGAGASGRVTASGAYPPERARAVGPGAFGSSASALSFAPGHGAGNPSFSENGFRVETFWAVKTGTPGGSFKRAHFHPADLSSGFEALHLGNQNELHGIYIKALDGKTFGLSSVRYRVTRNRQLVWKPFSIEGFSNFNVQVLVGRTFDPRWSIRGQFVAFPVGLPVGNDLTLPWWVLRIYGFEVVDQIYLASSASVDLDDIVLTRAGGAGPSVPGGVSPAGPSGLPDRW